MAGTDAIVVDGTELSHVPMMMGRFGNFLWNLQVRRGPELLTWRDRKPGKAAGFLTRADAEETRVE
ncbi:hypothetical protein DC522_03605 [Microvirga sp. KLBC 81]|nr:hypothetical protein DC522_03605 [Microvirga sp. KLBC 81]